ncbi:hypothetical protein BT63DRAFT_428356 [Microthyrium microscopicum]|uniref:Uncharacterized protein n=1 Tax=Microthyrium microscopicum TaxID=703497 RepID=A0A6A6TZ91_9PEZI|nr:hypothetical protein BT63DRAFT_428356 [Microthyrium microscopicum]
MEPQNPDVRKGRRELSTSKRAAQNRAAQVSLFLSLLAHDLEFPLRKSRHQSITCLTQTTARLSTAQRTIHQLTENSSCKL